MNRLTRTIAAAVATTVVAVLYSAGPATALADGAISPPSWAEFTVMGVSGDGVGSQADASGSFRVRIADVNSDGLRAVAWIEVLQPSGLWLNRQTIQDADGHNTSYTTYDYKVAPGKKVRLWACVQDGPDGWLEGCQHRTFISN